MDLAMNSKLIASTDAPVIVGLGATGLSCARYFQRQGVPFSVVDSRVEPPGLEDLRNLCPEAEIMLGSLPAERLMHAGRLIVSPGISLEEPAIAAARSAGVTVQGDIDLFVADATAPVVGITGSNGKSTVTELLGRMARRADRNVGVGGNLGTPALDLLATPADLYILELSSFQLERAGQLGLHLACNLNMSADHLDRHGDMQNYHRAKHRVFLGCESLVYNREDPLTRPLQADTVSARNFGLNAPDLGEYGLRLLEGTRYLCRGQEPLVPEAKLAMTGRHNVANALACLAMGELLGLSIEAMCAELREFPGLAHRCQTVARCAGVRYINDSKATNPGATSAALRGLNEAGGLVLLAGGQGKGADFSGLAKDIAQYCKHVVLMGEDADLLEAAIAGRTGTTRVTSMTEAVESAAAIADEGDIVLLSPACASFDMFDSFGDRGNRFAAAVQQLSAGGDSNG